MVEFVNVAVPLKYWNMIISLHFLVVVVALYQISNYFVKNAIEVSQIVAIVKYMINELALIVVQTT
jgi:high-affinity K+ transport system ATPase subunit B